MDHKKWMAPENRALMKVILALAWPTVIEEVMYTAVQYIDTAMVGVLGTAATAAVGSTSTVGWLVAGSVSAVGVGFLSYIARAMGSGDQERARRSVSQAVLAALVLGSLYTVVCQLISGLVPVWMQVEEAIRPTASRYFAILYLPMLPRACSMIFGTVLRAAGDTRTPMRVGVLVNLINVALNFFLIYEPRSLSLFGLRLPVPGAGMGVIGAAAASAIAYTLGGLLITRALWQHPTLSPRGQSLKPDKRILLPCLRVALPNMLQRFGTSLGFVFFSAMINALGGVATAAHTIANTVESAFYIPGYGMQTAASTLTGNAYGAGDRQRMHKLSRLFLPLVVGLMALSGGALFLGAPRLMGLFSDSPEVIDLGTRVLRMVALSEPFYGFSIIIEGLLLGVGKTRTPFVFNVLGMWCVRIAGTALTTRVLGFGLEAAWGCMIAHNLLLFVLYLVTYIRGTWDPLRDKV